VGVVLSRTSVASVWVKKEVDIAMNQEIKGKRVKVLPLLIEDCDLPGFLEGKMYADFRTADIYRQGLIKIANRLGVSIVSKRKVNGKWSGATGLLSLAQHGEDIIGEYQWESKKWNGDIVGKIIGDRLIFRWSLKNGTQQGVGIFDIEEGELLGAYWFQSEAPSYLTILADPDKMQKLLVVEGRRWEFRKVS
jgi:hypothetical protein